MYRTLLHLTDLQEDHFILCQKAADLAKCFGATLHLFHGIEVPPLQQLAQGLGFSEVAMPLQDDAKTVMRVVGDALGLPDEQLHVAVGPIKLCILELVKTLSCDLIVLGSHNPSHLPYFIGSTAHAVAHHAPCDVLTLRD